jgi:tRNA pseudouridine55 synthase
LLNVNKSRGPTSHDVVALARRALGTARVGHAGTLDPRARGVLPLLVGTATRLARFFIAYRKRYEAVIKLGAETASGDDEGEVLYERPVAPAAFEKAPAAARSFIGEITQEVPAYAAVKQGGEPLYRRARRGEVVTPPSRPVTIFALDVVTVAPPTLTVVVECSAGTYIRALARDLGRQLGTGGYLVDLCRLAVGPFALADALAEERLRQGDAAALTARPHFTPTAELLPDMPAETLSPAAAADFSHGRPFPLASWLRPGAFVRCRDEAGELLGIAVALGGGRARPDTVLVPAP